MSDAEMIELNASLERDAQRRSMAIELAKKAYGPDDVEVVLSADDESQPSGVQSVDGGYWVGARIFVGYEEVEDACGFQAPIEIGDRISFEVNGATIVAPLGEPIEDGMRNDAWAGVTTTVAGEEFVLWLYADGYRARPVVKDQA